MLAGKGRDVVIIGKLALEQLLHVGEHSFVLVLHVAAHFLGILVEELQNEVGHIVVRLRAVDGFDEFAADAGQVEVEEIGMGAFQIIHEGGDGEVVLLSGIGILFLADKVGHGKEGRAIYTLRLADVFHILVSESQRQPEAAHHH